MNIEDAKIKLSANLPVDIGNLLYYPTPFKIVAEVGWSLYNHYLSLLLIDKASMEKEIDERVSNFDIFYANCYHNPEFKDVAFSALRLFFMDEPEMIEEDESVFFGFSASNKTLNHSNFDNFQKILKIAHNLKESQEKEFDPANSTAQKMIDMILKNKSKRPPKKEKIDLNSIVTSLAWKSNGISILNIYDLNIYQIYQGFFVTKNIDDFNFTLSGIYAGTVDGKKIDMADIHWANKPKD